MPLTVRRMLLAVLATVALLSMHGIAASSASAATPCGEVPGHVHAMPSVDVPPVDVPGPVVTSAVLDPSHAGMTCLAILVGGLLLLLVGHRARRADGPAGSRALSLLPAVGVRGPPPRERLTSLCSWRT